MANKVITISSNDSNKQKNIQQYSFLDVSMLSEYTSKVEYKNEYEALLIDENDQFFITDEDGNAIDLNFKETNFSKNSDPNASTSTLLSENKLKVANLKDIEAIKNSLHNIFTWIPGERILNPEFGCNLRRLLYNGITEFNKEQIAAEVRQSVSKWEPRVKIEKIVDVGTVDDTENNTVCLDIIFSIPELNNGQLYKQSYVQKITE